MLQAINQTNFKGIYTNGQKFSEAQNVVKNDIISKLRKPVNENLSIEKFYKKNLTDFRIIPIDTDKVELQELQDTRINKKTGDLEYRRLKSRGVFDKENPYNPKLDLEWMKEIDIANKVAGAILTILLAASIFL